MSSESYNVITNFIYNVQGDMKVGQMDRTLQQMGTTTSGVQRALENMAGYLARDFVNAMSRGAQEAVDMGVKIGSLEASFQALVDAQDGTQISIEDLRKATKGTVADIDLLTSANNALLLGIPTDAILEMMNASVSLGAAVGKDTLYAVESLTTGVGRQSRLMLDNVGIIVKADQAYTEFAASIGKKVDALTQDERTTAFVNAAMDAMRQRTNMLGDAVDGTTLEVQRLSAGLDNAKVAAGSAAVEGFGPLASMLAGGLLPALAAVGGPALGTAIGSLVGAGGLTAALGTVAAAIPPVAVALGGAAVLYAALTYEADEAAESIIDSALRLEQGLLTEAEAIADFGSVAEAELSGFTVMVDRSFEDAGDSIESIEQPLTTAEEAIRDYADTTETELEKAYYETQEYIDAVTAAYQEYAKSVTENQMRSYEEALEDLNQYWVDYYSENLSGMDRAFDAADAHYDDLQRELEESHRDQLYEVNNFYDEMLAAERSFLDEIRGARRDDLMDLELDFLLRKQALTREYEEGRISKKAYEEALTNLERNYRDQRTSISENYRIKEIQQEQQFSRMSETIEAERAAAIADQETNLARDLYLLNAQKRGDMQNMYQKFLEYAKTYGGVISTEFEDLATVYDVSMVDMKNSAAALMTAWHNTTVTVAGLLDELRAKLAADITEDPMTVSEPVPPPGGTMGIDQPTSTVDSYHGIPIWSVKSGSSLLYGSDYTPNLRFNPDDVVLDLKKAGYALGYQGWITKPTSMLVGEAGAEYVSVTPQSKMGNGGGPGRSVGDVNIHLNLPGVREIPSDVNKIKMLSRKLGQYVIDQLASEGVI